MTEIGVVAESFNTEEARAELLAWFDQYDSLVGRGDVEAMADMAVFPLNEVTDDADGFGIVGTCDRARFLEQMRAAVGDGGDVTMESTRRPIFLSPSLCFVVTDAAITVGGDTQRMTYGDLLIRTREGWRFQTMVAAGFHAQM